MSQVARTESPQPPQGDGSVLRELIVFEAKLALDGLKDIVLAPLAIVAALWDMALEGRRGRRRLAAVLQVGENFERWLNLYGHHGADAAQRTAFGQAGSDLLIDQIEDLARGAHDSIASSRSEKKRLRERQGRPEPGQDRND
jgi:hypothetical protein